MKINEVYKRILSSIILIPTTFLIIYDGEILFKLFLIFCLAVSLYEWNNMSKNKLYFLPGIIFIFFSFYTVNYFRIYYDGNKIFYFYFIILICIATDIGGYVFGKFIRGPKITKISPKKTYAGLLGSYIFAILAGLLFFVKIDLKLDVNYYLTIVIISTISQLGDIAISFFKRKSNLKDTGKLIPGHGGILDRIDGMIFTFPFLYFSKSLLNL
jgi:phosphatidate cytidylyltransferase